jgi:hypothetical protein
MWRFNKKSDQFQGQLMSGLGSVCCAGSYNRSESISANMRFEAISRIFDLIFKTIVSIYIGGLLWYRFSEYWQSFLFHDDNEAFYFVNRFGFTEEESIFKVVITLMYFMLTTLSTVGYGDYYPSSIAEKIVGIFIEIVGVTIFSILMNQFIDVVLNLMGEDESAIESELTSWFAMIRHIRNQPYKGSKDISHKLKNTIEAHFKYFWQNDRNSVLLEKRTYFDAIPFSIQEIIVTEFLFKDVLGKVAFNSFFATPQSIESDFAYQIAFGFMPRHYSNTPEDRYVLEEEGDVTEITFVTEGNWAIAFNTYVINEDGHETEE